jgi:DNA polymerase type B, organellar and viral
MNNKYRIKTFNHDIDNIITKADIIAAIKRFSDEVLSTYSLGDRFSIMFKIRTKYGNWRCISTLQKEFDKTKVNDLIEIFYEFWTVCSEYYHQLVMSKISFSYKLIDPEFIVGKTVLNWPSSNKKIELLMPQGSTNLPNNREFSSWGTLSTLKDGSLEVRLDNKKYIIKVYNGEYHITLYSKYGEILKFVDKYCIDEKNRFTREIGNTKMYYENGECVFIKQELKTKFMQPKNPDTSIKSNFLTMDLETRTINDEMSVISASIFDGVNIKSFYLTDFSNSDEMVENAIRYLTQRKYNGYRVYIHNFTQFDGIFLVKIMANMQECKIEQPIRRNGLIINLKLTYNILGKRKYSLYFRDSLLLLPSSLRKLGESFGVDIKKSIFPYSFVNNENINLNYIGKIPSYDKFDGITLNEYNDYCSQYNNNSWSLRDELVKYCENDVISLYLIIKEFQKMIFRLYEADINNYRTLSSLAFAIYRIKYLYNHKKIPIISGEIYRNIRQSYTGGSVDVYKPIGKNVNRYDVNSLYPYVMGNFPSPVGNISKFRGDIFKYEENPFGFFYVNVKTPDYLHIPILQTRVRVKQSGERTVSPLGEWSGWYFSEEINNAKKYGYKFETVWGYTFDKGYIFKDYVNDLYKMKRKSIKDSPMYIIAKLLLNSLYGRFGMSPDKEKCEIIKGYHNINSFIYNNKNKILDQLELGEDIQLISYVKDNEFEEDNIYESINVSIASSITSYGRILMSEIKTKYSDNLYYSDTDSIDLDIKLPKKYINKNIGSYKFEEKFSKVIYIAPKVYAAVTDNDKEFIKVKGLKLYRDINDNSIRIKNKGKDHINFNKLVKLMNKSKDLEFYHNKLYKNIIKGKIISKEERYTLMVTENKRKLIYDKNNKLINTQPYKLMDGKLS